jgi:GntR family transcriptional regulator
VGEIVREVAYRVLAERLRTAIRAGEFADGSALPTEERLAATYSLSRSTVRRAMQDLVSEGTVYRVAGRGTFPMGAPDRYLRHFGSVEDLMALSVDTDCEILSPLERRVDIEAAGRLRLESDSVMTLMLRRLYGSVPFSVTTVTLPPFVGQLLSDVEEFASRGARSTLTVIGSIDARRPRLIVDAEQSITAIPAPAGAAEHMACQPGDAVLRVDRVYSDADGQPVELAVSYFDPSYYTYRVRLRRRMP